MRTQPHSGVLGGTRGTGGTPPRRGSCTSSARPARSSQSPSPSPLNPAESLRTSGPLEYSVVPVQAPQCTPSSAPQYGVPSGEYPCEYPDASALRCRRHARLLIGENCIGKKQISLHSYEHESSSRDRSSCLRYTGVLTPYSAAPARHCHGKSGVLTGVLTRGVLAGTTNGSSLAGGRPDARKNAPLREVCRAHGAVAAAVDVPKPNVERRRREPAAAAAGACASAD